MVFTELCTVFLPKNLLERIPTADQVKPNYNHIFNESVEATLWKRQWVWKGKALIYKRSFARSYWCHLLFCSWASPSRNTVILWASQELGPERWGPKGVLLKRLLCVSSPWPKCPTTQGELGAAGSTGAPGRDEWQQDSDTTLGVGAVEIQLSPCCWLRDLGHMNFLPNCSFLTWKWSEYVTPASWSERGGSTWCTPSCYTS